MSNLTIQQKLRAMGGSFDNATETQISCKDVADYIDALQAELDALRQQLASSEPVAWKYKTNSIHTWITEVKPPDDAYDEYTLTALYTHPQSASVDELIKSGQAVVDRWDSPNWKDGKHTADFIHALRNALAKYKKGGF